MAVYALSFILSLFLSLIPLAAAADPISYEECVTELSPQSPRGPIQTTTYFQTIFVPHDVWVTTTPGITVTPSVVTVFSTLTATATTASDAPQVTDTYTDTVTTSTTITLTVPTTILTATITTSVTSTSTISANTTIAAPSGFTPILDTLPGSDAAGMRKRGSRAKPAAALGDSALQKHGLPGASKGESNAPRSYPVRVICVDVIESFAETTITITAKTTTTATVKTTPSTTVFIDFTTTITTVVTTPDALTTVTVTETNSFTATVTPSTTTTFTSTTTVVIPSYTSSAYAICQVDTSRNLAYAVDGYPVVQVEEASSSASITFTTIYGNIVNVPICCNKCAANPLCAVSALGSAGDCYLWLDASDAVCPVNGVRFTAEYYTGLGPGGSAFLNNGYCGQFDSAVEVTTIPDHILE